MIKLLEFIVIIVIILSLNFNIVYYVKKHQSESDNSDKKGASSGFSSDSLSLFKSIIFFLVFFCILSSFVYLVIWLVTFNDYLPEKDLKKELVEVLSILRKEETDLELQINKIMASMNELVISTVLILPYFAQSLYKTINDRDINLIDLGMRIIADIRIIGAMRVIGGFIQFTVFIADFYKYFMTFLKSIKNYMILMELKDKYEVKRNNLQKRILLVENALFIRKIYDILLREGDQLKESKRRRESIWENCKEKITELSIKNFISETDLQFLSQFLLPYLYIILIMLAYSYFINNLYWSYKIELYICNFFDFELYILPRPRSIL